MSIKVRIPTPLRKLTDGKDEVDSTGTNVGDIINDLESQHAGIKERICDEGGNLRRFVNIYLNDEDIRFQNNLDTAVKDGDEVSIIPAIAGGNTVKKKCTSPFPRS